MSKLYVHFNKNGNPDKVLPEDVYLQLQKQKIKTDGNWEIYRPDKLYLIPWAPNPKIIDLRSCDHTLEEVLSAYVQLVFDKNNGVKSKTAAALGIDRKTLYRYLDIAEDLEASV